MQNPGKTYLYFSLMLWGCITVFLGAFTRISDAGLGCPDWPGCFGEVTAPFSDAELSQALIQYPLDVPASPYKAWLEMIHRYAASLFGGIIIFTAIKLYFSEKDWFKKSLSIALIALVLFQGALGMWTVTLKLHPVVVMGHLLGGMMLTSIMAWLFFDSIKPRKIFTPQMPSVAKWIRVGIFLLAFQIVLGGWTSATYSGTVCATFPYCEGSLIPKMDFISGFTTFPKWGANYQGGVMTHSARMAVHMAHRYYAFFVVFFFVITAFKSLSYSGINRFWPYTVLSILALQVLLGVLNVWWYLPVSLAVLHNAVGLTLLLVSVAWYMKARYQ
ncbi:MAG: COX15/CtaA family protein [Pseudomonadota bacterium]|nr:COX15/CtaA family protein [Pseudomonadota bacterium]